MSEYRVYRVVLGLRTSLDWFSWVADFTEHSLLHARTFEHGGDSRLLELETSS